MTTPIEQVKLGIADLEKQRDTIYLQLKDIEEQLKQKNVILNAFILVSSNASLYSAWQQQATLTPPPTPSN